MKSLRKSIIILLFAAMTGLMASCGSQKSSQDDQRIDGTYVYQDNICRSVVNIYGNQWDMTTRFGAPGYYGSEAKHDSGIVKGNTLYYSGFIEYGKVSGRTLTLAGRNYRKE